MFELQGVGKTALIGGLYFLTRVGFLHCRQGKTWKTRKESRQGSYASAEKVTL
jgi:hypothetical protein